MPKARLAAMLLLVLGAFAFAAVPRAWADPTPDTTPTTPATTAATTPAPTTPPVTSPAPPATTPKAKKTPHRPTVPTTAFVPYAASTVPTSTTSTTSTTIAPIENKVGKAPQTVPLTTRGSNGHVNPVFAILSGVGFGIALLIVLGRLVVTRSGGRDRRAY